MNHRISFLAIAICGASLFSFTANAQIRASEASTITQVIDGTEISIEYSRPSVRDRGEVIGDIVKLDYRWTPGANWATTFEFSKDVTMNENTVPAGKYSVWLVTSSPEWEVILDPENRKWHTDYPEEKEDQIRFPVTPGRADAEMETLVWYFPRVRGNGAELKLHWGHTTVEFDIGVESTREFDVAEDVAVKYSGHYQIAILESQFMPAHDFDTQIEFNGEYLLSDIHFNAVDDPATILFAPAADHIFNLAWYISNEVAGVMEQIFIEFEMDEDGDAQSFVVRFPTDDIWMRGSRIRP